MLGGHRTRRRQKGLIRAKKEGQSKGGAEKALRVDDVLCLGLRVCFSGTPWVAALVIIIVDIVIIDHDPVSGIAAEPHGF